MLNNKIKINKNEQIKEDLNLDINDLTLEINHKSYKGINSNNLQEINNSKIKINNNIKNIEKNRHFPLFWNEKKNENFEDLLNELIDEKSNNIFELFNDIRINPKNYIINTLNQDISNLLEQAEESNTKPNFLIKNENYYYILKGILLDLYNQKINDEEILNNINNNKIFNYFNKNLYFIECQIENEKDAIWNLLRKYKKEALNNFLLKKLDYFITCSIPIKDSYKMKVYFLILSR